MPSIETPFGRGDFPPLTEKKLVAPALFINAHPDDESFGFGGTIALLSSLHRPTTIVSLTRGERGQSAIHLGGSHLGDVRGVEFVEATRALGVCSEHVRLYDLPDGCLNTVTERLELTIEEIIRATQPSRIFTMHPLSTSHPDHIAVAQAVLSLRERGRIGLPNVLLQYLPHKYTPSQESTKVYVPIGTLLSQKIDGIRKHTTQNVDIEKIVPKLLNTEHYVLV